MNLPGLTLQALYTHFAWGVLLSACGVGLLRGRRPLAIGWAVLAFAACAWPGPASPAYWLGLAFHYPSGLLVAGCALTLWLNLARGGAGRVMPAGLAAALVLAGLLLYLDSSGWLSLGLYARGFGHGAALTGLLLGAAAVIWVARGPQHGMAWAVLLALMLFAVCRLPSGNVWDALLDPMLWLWALFSLLARAIARRAAGASVQPA
jgi:hypothetical protein